MQTTTTLEIYRAKKYQYFNLAFTIFWLGLAALSYEREEGFDFVVIGYGTAGILYFVAYLLSRKPYLIIANNAIHYEKLFKKHAIAFDDITLIKKSAGDYLIKTESKELLIAPSVMSKEDKEKLWGFLERVEMSMTPFLK